MMLGHEISRDLCDALGLPKRTRGFTLRCYTGEAVSVECEYYPDGSFQGALAHYELAPRPGNPLAAPFDFETWMNERIERAHREHMDRTSQLPMRARRVYTQEEIAKFYGIPHGGID